MSNNVYLPLFQGFLGGSEVKNLPAMQETQVRSLDWENPLEKEMATHSSILARRIFWTEEPGGLQSMGSQKSWIQLHLLTHTHTHWTLRRLVYT